MGLAKPPTYMHVVDPVVFARAEGGPPPVTHSLTYTRARQDFGGRASGTEPCVSQPLEAARASLDKSCARLLWTSAAIAIARHFGGPGPKETKWAVATSPPWLAADERTGQPTLWRRESSVKHPWAQARGNRPIRLLVAHALQRVLIPYIAMETSFLARDSASFSVRPRSMAPAPAARACRPCGNSGRRAAMARLWCCAAGNAIGFNGRHGRPTSAAIATAQCDCGNTSGRTRNNTPQRCSLPDTFAPCGGRAGVGTTCACEVDAMGEFSCPRPVCGAPPAALHADTCRAEATRPGAGCHLVTSVLAPIGPHAPGGVSAEPLNHHFQAL